MLPDGSYTILILWAERESADIRDVMDTLRVVKEYITKHMLPMPYKLDRRSDHAIPIPDVKMPAIKSMQHTMLFDNPRGLDFIAMKNLAMCFAPYIALDSELNAISKFWKRIPRYGAILKKLDEKHLQENKSDIKELRTEVRELAEAVRDLKCELQKERTERKHDYETLQLQLRITLMEFERRLPPAPPAPAPLSLPLSGDS